MKKMTDIIWYDTVTSTNDEAKKNICSIRNTTVFAARKQTAGRGQRGNVWKSEEGRNLTFSMAMKPGLGGFPEIRPDCQFAISEAVTIGICNVLSQYGVEAKIKWPNDIYIGDGKICGILIENAISDGRLYSSIAGIGINLNQVSFPPEVPNPVSLAMITGREYDLNEVLAQVSDNICSMFGMISSAPDTLRKEYLKKLYRKDEEQRYIDCTTGEKFSGIIRGISPSALLRVELPDKSVKEFAFKEIQYII